MYNQDIYYGILQKKYNILRKNLIIIEQTEEKINEFKNTIKELDRIETEIFSEKLKEKKKLTTNLEDEYKRLYEYIYLIEQRQKNREEMLKDYNNIVKESLDDLEKIEDYENIEFYLRRLDDINEYLTNDEKYEKLNEENDKYIVQKNEYEEKYNNLHRQIDEFELNLMIQLKTYINSNKIFDNLDFDKIEESINEYEEKLKEKERELNTYLNSYDALINVNISLEEKEEYEKFINEEKNDFVNCLEKIHTLLIYKYLTTNNLEKTLEIYEDRIKKNRKYNIEDESEIIKLFEKVNTLKIKKELLEEIKLNIENIDNNLESFNEKIEEIKNKLNKENIKTLLKEFCIEKEYINNEEIKEDIVNEIEEEKQQELPIIEEIKEEESNVEETLENKISEEEKKENSKENIDDNVFEVLQNINLENESNNKVEENMESSFFEPEEVIFFENDKQEITEDNYNNETEDDIKVEIMEDIVENPIIENDTEEIDNRELEIKENAIKEIKDINSNMLIDTIRQKSLNIMKSVCQSVI